MDDKKARTHRVSMYVPYDKDASGCALSSRAHSSSKRDTATDRLAYLHPPMVAGLGVVPFRRFQVVNVNQASTRRNNREIADIMEVRGGNVAFGGGCIQQLEARNIGPLAGQTQKQFPKKTKRAVVGGLL